jgi:hypothetical protein
MYRYWDAILVLIEKTYLFHTSGCILVGQAMPYFKKLLGGHKEGAGIQAEFFGCQNFQKIYFPKKKT